MTTITLTNTATANNNSLYMYKMGMGDLKSKINKQIYSNNSKCKKKLYISACIPFLMLSHI